MATFDLFEEDYGEMFFSQTPNEDKVVSLEEEGDFKTVLDPIYSDISDFEEDDIGIKMRFVHKTFFCALEN